MSERNELSTMMEFDRVLALVQELDDQAMMYAQQMSEPQFARVNPVHKVLLNALPSHVVLSKNTAADLSGTTCSICIDGYRPRQHYLTMDCGHSFHKICVHRWFTKYNRTCPVCRKDPFQS